MGVLTVDFWIRAIIMIGLEEQHSLFLSTVGSTFKTNLFTAQIITISILDTNRFSQYTVIMTAKDQNTTKIQIKFHILGRKLYLTLETYLYHLTPQKYHCFSTQSQKNICEQQWQPNYQDHLLTPPLIEDDDPPSFWQDLVSSCAC